MAPLRTQVAGRTGSMQPSTLHHMSYRCRSHSVVRVPRSHTHTLDAPEQVARARLDHRMTHESGEFCPDGEDAFSVRELVEVGRKDAFLPFHGWCERTETFPWLRGRGRLEPDTRGDPPGPARHRARHQQHRPA